MLIGQGQLKIGGLLLVTALRFGEILSFGLRSSRLYLVVVLKLEFRALAQGVCELLWLRQLLVDFSFG